MLSQTHFPTSCNPKVQILTPYDFLREPYVNIFDFPNWNSILNPNARHKKPTCNRQDTTCFSRFPNLGYFIYSQTKVKITKSEKLCK